MGVLLFIWLACGLGAAYIASGKGRSGCGFFALGMFLGPFGIIVAALFSPTPEKIEADGLESGELGHCPSCRETVRMGATICPHCRTGIDWE
jgi:hypothetical protein